MTVKEKRGRRRYIYFETAGQVPATHEEMFQAILLVASKQGLTTVKLIQFDGSRGIVRSNLDESERLREIINAPRSGPTSFSSLRTSGTLRTLRDKYYPDLGLEKRSKKRTK